MSRRLHLKRRWLCTQCGAVFPQKELEEIEEVEPTFLLDQPRMRCLHAKEPRTVWTASTSPSVACKVGAALLGERLNAGPPPFR